jgi:hypothetical protein
MPQSARALARLLNHENNTADFMLLLFEHAPRPLVQVLGLPDGDYVCRREVLADDGRLDLVVYRVCDEHPAAVLEFKGASAEHGDQLERYRAWAQEHQPAPALFYCTLDGPNIPTPHPAWQALNLSDLFHPWTSCADPHSSWLARQIVDLLIRWDREAEGPIGQSTGGYVADLVARRTAYALTSELRHDHPDGAAKAVAVRSKGGHPELLAWRQHPHGSPDALIGVDVRCPDRGAPDRPWAFRPYVEVLAETGDPAPRAAWLEAHDLALHLQPAMLLPAVHDALVRQGRQDLVGRLSAPGRRQGLRNRAVDATVLAAHRGRLETLSSARGKLDLQHPVFFHDWGLRLATRFWLDVAQVDRHQLAALVRIVLDHLVAQAEALGSRLPRTTDR